MVLLFHLCESSNAFSDREHRTLIHHDITQQHDELLPEAHPALHPSNSILLSGLEILPSQAEKLCFEKQQRQLTRDHQHIGLSDRMPIGNPFFSSMFEWF